MCAGAPELRALLVGRMAYARDTLGWPAARALTLRAVMRSGVLGGQPAHFRSHAGDLLLSGARPTPCLSEQAPRRACVCMCSPPIGLLPCPCPCGVCSGGAAPLAMGVA